MFLYLAGRLGGSLGEDAPSWASLVSLVSPFLFSAGRGGSIQTPDILPIFETAVTRNDGLDQLSLRSCLLSDSVRK